MTWLLQRQYYDDRSTADKRSSGNSLRHNHPLGLGESHPYSKASEERVLGEISRESVQLLCGSIAGLQTSSMIDSLTASYPLGNGYGRIYEDVMLAGYARLLLFVLAG